MSAEEWMYIFNNELISIPVLVCLTHADDLYENCKEDIVPVCPEEKVKEMKMKFHSELEVFFMQKSIFSTYLTLICSFELNNHISYFNFFF